MCVQYRSIVTQTAPELFFRKKSLKSAYSKGAGRTKDWVYHAYKWFLNIRSSDIPIVSVHQSGHVYEFGGNLSSEDGVAFCWEIELLTSRAAVDGTFDNSKFWSMWSLDIYLKWSTGHKNKWIGVRDLESKQLPCFYNHCHFQFLFRCKYARSWFQNLKKTKN